MAEQKLPGEKEPSFRGVLDAVRRVIRRGSLGAQRRVSAASKGLSLRGAVNLIPIQDVERNRQSAEARAASTLGTQRLGQLGQLESLREQSRLGREDFLFRRQLGQDDAATASRRAFQGALLKKGIDFGFGFLGKPKRTLLGG